MLRILDKEGYTVKVNPSSILKYIRVDMVNLQNGEWIVSPSLKIVSNDFGSFIAVVVKGDIETIENVFLLNFNGVDYSNLILTINFRDSVITVSENNYKEIAKAISIEDCPKEMRRKIGTDKVLNTLKRYKQIVDNFEDKVGSYYYCVTLSDCLTSQFILDEVERGDC